MPNGPPPIGAIIAFVIAALFIGFSVWAGFNAFQQQNRAKELMASGEDMQLRLAQRAEQIQAKELEILTRWESVLKRLEALVNRIEMRN